MNVVNFQKKPTLNFLLGCFLLLVPLELGGFMYSASRCSIADEVGIVKLCAGGGGLW